MTILIKALMNLFLSLALIGIAILFHGEFWGITNPQTLFSKTGVTILIVAGWIGIAVVILTMTYHFWFEVPAAPKGEK